MLSKDREENLKRSFYKYFHDQLAASYYIIYSAFQDIDLGKRLMDGTLEGYWKWMNIGWLSVGPGIFCVAKVQIDCNTVMVNDRLKNEIMNMVTAVQEALNVDTIPILDFSDDPLNPEATDNVLIPRYRGSKTIPDKASDTVNVEAVTYDIHIWRESVLP